MKDNFPFDLVSVSPLSHILLNLCSKEDLLDLCDDYQIAGNKSMNKTNLALRIEATLLKYPEQFARCLPLYDLQALQKIVQAGGVLQSKKPLMTHVLEEQMLVLSPETTIDKNQETVFRYAIAQNLQKALKPIINQLVADPKLKVLDKNERLLLGLLRIYGVISEHTLRDIWEKTIKEQLDPYDLIQLFRTRILIKQEYLAFYADNKLCFAPIILDLPWEMYEKIKKRSDLDYATYPVDAVLSYAGSPFYSLHEKTLLSLVQWLNDKNRGDTMQTTLQLGLIWESIQTDGKLTELIQDLLDTSTWESVQEINELMLRLTDYTNDAPHWSLKGHTLNELLAKNPIKLQDPNFRRDINKQLKQQYPDVNANEVWRRLDEKIVSNNVGRNDPCPCGSGKKYKKCCGFN